MKFRAYGFLHVMKSRDPSSESLDLAVGEVVRLRRESLGLTIKAVADRAGLGVSSLHALEHGRLTLQLDNFLRILRVLDLDIANVLPGKLPAAGTSADAQFKILLAERAREDLADVIRQLARAVTERRAPGRAKAGDKMA